MTTTVKCECGDQCIPTHSLDDGFHCDRCGRATDPWPGVPGAEYPTCSVCSEQLRPGMRRDADCCSAACRAEKSRRKRLGAGEAVDGYADLDSYRRRSTRRDRA